MDKQATAILESLLFVANGPVALEQLQKTLETSREQVEESLCDLDAAYAGRGLRLQRKNGEVQLVTVPEAGPYVERFLGLQLSGKLSSAAVEALAIVAYRQPVTRAQVEAIRGVNSDGVLSTLVARGLVTEVGRMDTAGRPILYGTTFEFLEYFGLKHVAQMPRLGVAAEPDGRGHTY
jgi:segregation and condensation protein B